MGTRRDGTIVFKVLEGGFEMILIVTTIARNSRLSGVRRSCRNKIKQRIMYGCTWSKSAFSLSFAASTCSSNSSIELCNSAFAVCHVSAGATQRQQRQSASQHDVISAVPNAELRYPIPRCLSAGPMASVSHFPAKSAPCLLCSQAPPKHI